MTDARTALNQCRLAFAGYVSVQSAIDMLDAATTERSEGWQAITDHEPPGSTTLFWARLDPSWGWVYETGTRDRVSLLTHQPTHWMRPESPDGVMPEVQCK